MSNRRPEIPRLVFTITRLTQESYGLHAANPSLGLLFVDREEPLHPYRTAALMCNETVRKMMGDFYVGGTFRWTTHSYGRWEKELLYHHDATGDEHSIVINQHNICTPHPVNAPNLRLYVMVKRRLFKKMIHDIYVTCHELHRLIGCDKCPIDRDECMRRHTRLELDQLNLPGLDLAEYQDLQSERFLMRRRNRRFCLSDIEDEWKHWKTEIGGHLFIPPVLASPDVIMPGKYLYMPYELSFTDATLDGNRDELSARSACAAKTRNTKRKECTRCYFGDKGYKGSPTPCDKYAPRHCEHLAWTEEQVINETLIHFEDTIKASGFTMRNFEQLLAIAGNTLYVDRLKYVIRGFGFDDTNPLVTQIRLFRVTAEKRGHVRDLKSLEQLLALLKPDLRRTFEEAPALDRGQLAIAAQLTCLKSIESYTCMAGCIRQVQPTISHITLIKGGFVEIGYWLRSYWRDRVISSLSDIYNYFDSLPMFDIHRSPPEGVRHFRYAYWPR